VSALSAEPTDRELLTRVAAGSESALESLYKRNEQKVFRYAASLLRGDQERAADVTCDTFYEVWRSAKNFRGDSAASTWILGIARFKALSVMRGMKPTESDDVLAQIPADTEDPLETMAAADRVNRVRAALDSLSPAHREVLELAIYHELPYPKIAELVGCPLNTVKTRAFHARKQLQRILAETRA
jgi:RNA polymerase sigma-70 factor (ECF subfamily)